jgi:hypothetical protein
MAKVMVVRCMVRIECLEPVAVEAWAGGQALIFGRELGFTHIVLEGDSKIVVDAVNAEESY